MEHSRDAVDIALVVPLSGPAGMFGPSCEVSAELAVADINAAGGILDRPVRLHPVDAGAPLSAISAQMRRLVDTHSIDAVVGWHLSNARQVITPHTAGRVPYVYTTFYEGGENTTGVYMVGETPQQQLFPALQWLRANEGIRRWCIVGNDYIWPRQTAAVTKDYMRANGFDFAGDTFIPLGGRDFRAALDLIASSRADGVLVLMVGTDNAAFNRAFARAGLHEKHIRLSLMIGEDVLCASGNGSTQGLYTACGYFESLVTPENMGFGSRYEQLFGAAAPTLNNIGESCYEGLLLLAALAGAAGSLQVRAIDRVRSTVSYQGPRGEVAMRGAHTHQPVYLAETTDVEFRVIDQLSA
ncbi:substrate-binding domain-containing protein [Mycolicibacterium sp. J2]|jgi:ABC-type branched-subunit amino acid transport system substrate-binding protein|uniref:substrate-binding domain-containing protein n=1 Tax=Mycolicibacterium sp. J2 TaxID=2993511 RepID=UPI00224B6478|nr:substrate-binding domain-containing protein [Mycolicibacterium sp. J2]MCX2714104.1 substrate-binding domain-containing protein [Mycolicibacterium sp. J2]